jgi:hypothetical protein
MEREKGRGGMHSVKRRGGAPACAAEHFCFPFLPALLTHPSMVINPHLCGIIVVVVADDDDDDDDDDVARRSSSAPPPSSPSAASPPLPSPSVVTVVTVVAVVAIIRDDILPS